MEYLKKALPMQVKEFGTEEHVDVGETYGKMGWTCSRMGKFDQAMDEGHVDVGDSYNKIALCVIIKVNTRKHWTTTTKH